MNELKCFCSNSRMNGERLEDEWVMQQAMAMRAMEQVNWFIVYFIRCMSVSLPLLVLQAAYDEACMREQMKSDHLAFLRGQMVEQGDKKAEWDQTKRGTIDEEFFRNFGRGHR